MSANLGTEMHLGDLEQHHDIAPAEQELPELLALGQRGPGFDGQIHRRDLGHPDWQDRHHPDQR
jgi:hypothetical protein